MVGLGRLDNLQDCIIRVVADGVPGDLLEAGVWGGGASIFMRGVLRVVGDFTRSVWVADSFQGLPPPDANSYPADAGDEHWRNPELAVGIDEVRRNFERYGLLDERVRFLPGWFCDSLPNAPITRLSVLRLDGDTYQSAMEALVALYHKVSTGGFVIIDDYGAVPGCRQAVDDFRASRGITVPLTVSTGRASSGAWAASRVPLFVRPSVRARLPAMFRPGRRTRRSHAAHLAPRRTGTRA